MMVYSPLEQFALNPLIPWIPFVPFLHVGPFYLTFTQAHIYMSVSVGLFVALLWAITVRGGLILPSRYQVGVEAIYDFVNTLIREQIGKKGKPFFPFIFCLFTFLLCQNLIGMIPYSYTTTSQMVITFTLSTTVFLVMTFVGFETHGIHFFAFLFPPGAPLQLAPFLVVIEFVSYMFRAISLGVRLFANMMAGHTLVKIISMFGWKMLKASGFIVKVGALVPMAVVFALIFLEVGVACLQAYVFTILTCIYLNDAIHLH